MSLSDVPGSSSWLAAGSQLAQNIKRVLLVAAPLRPVRVGTHRCEELPALSRFQNTATSKQFRAHWIGDLELQSRGRYIAELKSFVGQDAYKPRLACLGGHPQRPGIPIVCRCRRRRNKIEQYLMFANGRAEGDHVRRQEPETTNGVIHDVVRDAL